MTAPEPLDISTRRRMRKWLRQFRRATPRAARQSLIDEASAAALLRELEVLPPTARASRWPLVLYLLAARSLQGPPLADDALIDRLAAVFPAPSDHVRTDIRRMTAELVRNHRHWARVTEMRRTAFLERQRKRAERGAVPRSSS
jgi:hypothetical protein